MEIKFVEAFYLDDSRNELKIQTDEEKIGIYKLYWTYKTDPFTKEKGFLLESDKKRLVFDFAYDKKKRNYFIIEFADHRPLLFGHRILPVSGMYNLRDLGGYITESGKRMKWGVGYRSDYFTLLGDAGLDYVRSLGIKTIIDFRNESEVSEYPNRSIGDHVVTYICDPHAHTAVAAGTLHNNEQMHSTDSLVARARAEVKKDPNAGDNNMKQQQLQFVSSKKSQDAYRKALGVLKEPLAHPVVQHCKGGKDRTGYAIMLLHGILGVPKELTVYDYMLTYRAREEKNTRYYQKYLDMTKDEAVAKYLFSFFDTKPEYIETSINRILKEYGTVRQYVKEVLSMDEESMKNIEDIFLES